MVATVLSLKARTMGHQLRREWWRVLLLAGGAIWSLTLLPLAWWAEQSLRYQPWNIKEFALVVVTLLFALGWVLVPLLITGLDDTLDPGRFASLGVRAKTMMPGLTVAAFLTVPALFFAAVLTMLAWAWRFHGTDVWLVGLVGTALTLAMLVLSARLSVMWASRLLASRRARTLSLLAGVLALALVAPAAWVLFQDGFELVLEYDIPVLVEQAGRTPLGAGAAAAAAAAQGHWWGVWLRLAGLALWVVLLHRAWRANVEYSLVNPVYRGGGTRQRHDTMLAGLARKPWGWHRWRLSTPARAVRIRSARYWGSDPRYLASMVGVLAFPVLFFALVMPAFGLEARWAFVAPVILAASIGWGRHNDVALDSTALWLDVVSGQLGKDIMWGRMAAIVTWALPAVLVGALATLAWTGLWSLAPAVVGACLGVLGLTLGISALTSVVLPYRAPAPGENPFGAEVGSVGASLVAQLAASVVTGLALPLVTVAFVLALVVDPAWGWLALVTGLGLGPGALAWAVSYAGRQYDRRSGSLVTSVA